MAQTVSPRSSPILHGNGRVVVHRSPSPPPPQPQSKRDKRRTMLAEKLSDMVASFSENHFEHYYAQLHAVQCDINLILRADPYRDGPLEDSREEIAIMIAGAREEVSRNRYPLNEEAEASFAALSGKYYCKFVDDVNTAMEERDRDLTMVYNHYQDGLDELRRTNQYKIQLAKEEHQLLSKTLRERLVQTVTQKRARLLRDKEQLDIADSNALLLHPSQFSIGNPASPGGPTSNRKTRYSRLRPGENTEDVASAAVENKRKRKAQADEVDHSSPAPFGRIPDAGTAPPYRDGRNKLIQSQFEASVYSIDRLFTEKELALNVNRAHVAATDFFGRLRMQGAEVRNAASSINETTRNGVDYGVDGKSAMHIGALATTDNAEHDLDAPGAHASPSLGHLLPVAPTYHATRSAQRANPLTDLAFGTPAVPPYVFSINTTTGKANTAAPTPPGLSEAEAQNDLLLMQRGMADPIYEFLVERCCEKQGPMTEVGWWKGALDGDGAGELNGGIEASNGPVPTAPSLAMVRQASGVGVGSVAMAKTNSVGGMSEHGGTSLGRAYIGGAEATTRTRGRLT